MDKRGKVSLRVALRFLEGATTPLPTLSKKEPGLLTLNEFLDMRNPEKIMHPPEAFDSSLDQMNVDQTKVWLARVKEPNKPPTMFFRTSHGILISQENSFSDLRLVGVIHQGTLYYSTKVPLQKIPTHYWENRNEYATEIPYNRTRKIKYLYEAVQLVSNPIRNNLAKYSVILQRFKVQGENLELRADGQPKKNEGTGLALLNEEGLVVGIAQSSWGATLLHIAKEYRGKGLGRILGKWWYKFNPDWESGGFSPGGKRNAERLWEDRVREWLSRGWYSQLLQENKITHERVNQILSGLGGIPKRIPRLPSPSTAPTMKKEILVYAQDETFIIYDIRFFQDPDEKYIHGHGFFRSSPHAGTYLYSIDYDREFHKFTTYVGLQMAKDSGYLPLYDGKGESYSDLLEIEGLPHIEQGENWVSLTQDVLPLRALARKEAMLRKKYDKYDEKLILLLEMAESKWR